MKKISPYFSGLAIALSCVSFAFGQTVYQMDESSITVSSVDGGINNKATFDMTLHSGTAVNGVNSYSASLVVNAGNDLFGTGTQLITSAIEGSFTFSSTVPSSKLFTFDETQVLWNPLDFEEGTNVNNLSAGYSGPDPLLDWKSGKPSAPKDPLVWSGVSDNITWETDVNHESVWGFRQTFTPVPEPAAAFFGAIGMAFIIFRRR